jgi:hypothetical protein
MNDESFNNLQDNIEDIIHDFYSFKLFQENNFSIYQNNLNRRHSFDSCYQFQPKYNEDNSLNPSIKRKTNEEIHITNKKPNNAQYIFN